MRKDITIIGGSAAGMLSAYWLARAGCRVRVFEGDHKIDPPPRTLIVTESFRSVLGPIADNSIVNTINRFELFADGRSASVSLRRPDLIVERSALIQNLAERAEGAGARILCDHRFLGLRPNGSRLQFRVATNSHTVESATEIVIGADGAFSDVARSAGWPEAPTVSLLQAVVDLPKDMPPHTTRVWFLPEETPYFYWLIPDSRNRGVLGLIGEDKDHTRKSLERFLEKKKFSALDFQTALIPRYTGWIPNHRRLGMGHVYLVGDAAGHVKVTTVGGIVTGFQGALGVVEAILKGGKSLRLRKLRHELDRHLLIRRVLHRFSQADYAKLLDMLGPSARHPLSAFTRDESSKLLFRLLVRQPALIVLGMRSLFLDK